MEEGNECVICLHKAITTVLEPCGHLQMCKKCCKEHLAVAESKGVKTQVMTV